MTKKAKGITCGIIGIVAIAAIIPSDDHDNDKKVESIELSIQDYQVEYDINTKIPVDIVISPADVDAESFHFVSDSDSMGLYLDGIFTGDVEGTFDVYVMVDDVTSNTITINVVDISAREYAMAEAEAQKDNTEQPSNPEGDEEQPSDDELSTQDVDSQTESNNTDQQSLEAQSDRNNENNSSETVAPPSIEEQPVENNADQQSTDVSPVQATEPQENTEVPTPEVPVVQQNPNANPPAEESGDASVPASSGNNNFDTYDNPSQQQTDFTYVLNTNTMKIHHPTCSSVPKIAPHNYATSNATLNDLLAQGYSTCGICFR